jgi:hypothetical protein
MGLIKSSVIRAHNRLAVLRQAAQKRGDYLQTDSLLKESLILAKEMTHFWGILESLWGLALSAGLQGHLEREACLLGVVEAAREDTGYPLTSTEQGDYERAIAASRVRMGASNFEIAWAKGRGMTISKAIAYALVGI